MGIFFDKVKRTPMEQLRFRDFARLKVRQGRDEYSAKRHESLRRLLDESDAAAIDAALSGARDQATAYRWHLRGLAPDKAIRKVKTDLEIRDNTIGGAR